MCVVESTVAGAAIANATLAIGAATTAASIGMSMYQAQQQQQQAQASMAMQQQSMANQSVNMQRSMELQNRQMTAQMQQQQQQQRQQQMLTMQTNRQNQIQQQNATAAQANLQVQQANTNILNQYQQQQRMVLNERAQIMRKNEIDRLVYQRASEEARDQIDFNNEGANRSYVAEQVKLSEAKKKAAFEQQNILAKSIGAKGTILASGRTGQSVGLLVNDVGRQAGFAMAQEDAMLDSKADQAFIGMDSAFLSAQSANNQAMSNMPFQPQDPVLPSLPDTPNFIELNIPT
jgi:hypothetical protein